MKSYIKKLAGIITAMALTVASVMPAMAAVTDTIDTSATGSLTIHKYDMTVAEEKGVDLSDPSFVSTGKANATAEAALAPYAIKGVEFTYLKVGDIATHSVTEGTTNTTKVIYGIDEELMSILGLDAADQVKAEGAAHYYTSDQLNAAMADALVANTVTKNALEGYIAGGTAMTLTDAAGESQATGLPVGLYLLVETKVPENVWYTTDPFFVSIPSTDVEGQDWFYDIEVYPKNQSNEPTIDKKVSEKGVGNYADTVSVSEGDIADYTIVSHLPKITSSASYLTKYTFVDTASKGLTYQEDSVDIYFYNSKEDAVAGDTSKAIEAWTDNTNFSVAFAGEQSGDHTMTVTMTATGLSELNTNTELAEKYLAIQYKVQIDSSEETVLGDTGNPNDVTLTWSRTNTREEQTIKDRSVVFTFGIDLKKNFEGGNGDAAKVKFVLKNSTDGYFVTATGSNGVYYVTDSTEGTTTEESQGTVFSPASDGTLKINGLEEDAYVLTEIATDAGFSLLKDNITITYTCTVPTIQETLAKRTGIGSERPELVYTAGNPSKTVIDNNEYITANGLGALTVVNTHTFTLPQTGGQGLWMVTVCGILVAGFGFVLLFGKRRESKEA